MSKVKLPPLNLGCMGNVSIGQDTSRSIESGGRMLQQEIWEDCQKLNQRRDELQKNPVFELPSLEYSVVAQDYIQHEQKLGQAFKYAVPAIIRFVGIRERYERIVNKLEISGIQSALQTLEERLSQAEAVVRNAGPHQLSRVRLLGHHNQFLAAVRRLIDFQKGEGARQPGC